MSTNLTELAEPNVKQGAAGSNVLLRSAAFVATCVLGVVILFLLFEGVGSTWFVTRDFVSYWRHGPDMVHSTQFDPELGWVNIPNLYDHDFYGPGLYLQTNSRGFRNREEFARQVPATKLRVICAGDSFTFGPGVDNDHVWCEQLSSLDHRLQTVNMGVPGYGADQIYLLQLREASQLDYDVQIFAVIAEDLRRSMRANSSGYGKPVLELRGDQLVATHVPVRKASIFSRFTFWIPHFSSVRLVQEVGGKFLPALLSSPEANLMDSRGEQKVTARMLENLQAANRRKNSVTVVLLLPTIVELGSLDSDATWRNFLRDESAKQGIVFLDLVADAKKLPTSESGKLFILKPQRYGFTFGHLTDYGNEYVSRRVYEALTANPEVSAKLSGLH